jgi:hypothetical protein
MEEVYPKRTLTDSVADLFRCLYDLAALRAGRNKGTRGESEKKYSPGVVRLLELCDHIKGWDTDSQDIYERDGYVAQLWYDKFTCNKVVVILKENCKKECFPVFYLPVPVEEQVEAVLSEALCKAGNQCEIRKAA